MNSSIINITTSLKTCARFFGAPIRARFVLSLSKGARNRTRNRSQISLYLLCILLLIFPAISAAQSSPGEADIILIPTNDGFPSEGDISLKVRSENFGAGITGLHYSLSYDPAIMHFQEARHPARPVFSGDIPADRTILSGKNIDEATAELSVASAWGYDLSVENRRPFNIHELGFLVTGDPGDSMDFTLEEMGLTASLFSSYEHYTTRTLFTQKVNVNAVTPFRTECPYTGNAISAKKGEIVPVGISVRTTGTLEGAFCRLEYDPSILQLRHVGQARLEGSSLVFSDDLGTTDGMASFAVTRSMPWQSPHPALPLGVAFFEVTGDEMQTSKIDFAIERAYAGMPARQKLFVEPASVDFTVSRSPEVRCSILPPDDPESILPGNSITLPIEIEWDGKAAPSEAMMRFQCDPDFMTVDNVELVADPSPFDTLKYGASVENPEQTDISVSGPWDIDTEWTQPLQIMEITGTIASDPPQSAMAGFSCSEAWLSGPFGRSVAAGSPTSDTIELSLFVTPTPTPTPTPTATPTATPTPTSTPIPTPTPMPYGILTY